MRTERLLMAAALSLMAGAASALNLQLKPSVHVEVQHDDNVFRVSDTPQPGGAPKVADTLNTLGAGAVLTVRESRQELEIKGEVERIDYADLDQLDYNRYQVGGTAKLAYASLLQLKLDAGRERRQESFAFRDDTDNGFITIDKFGAELRAALTPRWTGIAKGERYQTEASRLASQDYDLTENAGELGIEYRRDGYSSAGVAVRVAEGEYPRRIVTPGDGREKDYDQRTVLARVGYTPSGLSDLTAQLGYTQRRHDDAAVPDFSGITGSASYRRRFSGVSQLQLQAYRDLYYVEDINANYVENLGVRATYDYAWSAKLAFAVGAERYESSYEGSPGFNVGGAVRKDQITNFRIGAQYQPFYRFSILPEYRYERRGSNVADSAYDYNVFGVDLAYEYGAPRR